MKGSIMAALIVLCAVALTAAARPQDAPKEHSMTGCLRADGTAPKTYKLTDLDKGPKSVSIVATRVELAPHLGHKIEVTGTEVPAKDAEWASNVEKAPHYMKVSSVKMISATCP
jgi:hypothetical protein